LDEIILDDLKINVNNSIQFYHDNKTVKSITHNPVHHDKNKHNEIDRHFIKINLNRGPVTPTGFQLANIFTKEFPHVRFQNLVGKLGMIHIHSLN